MSSIFLLLATSFVVAGAFKFSDFWHQSQNNYNHNTNNDLFDLRRSETSNCTQRAVFHKVMSCSMPLEDLAEALSEGHFDAVDTPEELDAACQLLHEFEQCLGALNDTCGQNVTILPQLYEVVQNGVGFFCADESKTTFLAEIDCWKMPHFLDVAETCGEVIRDSESHPCSILEPMTICLHCSGNLLCNERAADYMVDFVNQTFGSPLDKMCSSQGRRSRGVMDTFPVAL